MLFFFVVVVVVVLFSRVTHTYLYITIEIN